MRMPFNRDDDYYLILLNDTLYYLLYIMTDCETANFFNYYN
jgi:hypothetical protein